MTTLMTETFLDVPDFNVIAREFSKIPNLPSISTDVQILIILRDIQGSVSSLRREMHEGFERAREGFERAREEQRYR